MNRFYLSKNYKLLRKLAALLCAIAAICLLSANTLAAIPQQASGEEQAIQFFMGETDLERYQIPQGKVISIPVIVQYPSSDVKIGAVSVKVSYDATHLQPVGCLNELAKDESYNAFCNYDKQPGIILLNAVDTDGLDEKVNLAMLEFHALGAVGSEADLALEVRHIANLNGERLSYVEQGGMVEIVDASATDCAAKNACATYDIYLPIIE